MPSAIDPTHPPTGAAASKDRERANWTAARAELEHGGFFTQAGAAAVERLTRDKLREVISVKDFGAVGDGVTDDRAAIQAALDHADGLFTTGSALGGAVWFPHGTYRVSGMLRNGGRVSMYGASPRAVRIRAMAGFPATTVDDDATLGGVTFDTPMLWIDSRGRSEISMEIAGFYLDGDNIAPVGLLVTQGANPTVR